MAFLVVTDIVLGSALSSPTVNDIFAQIEAFLNGTTASANVTITGDMTAANFVGVWNGTAVAVAKGGTGATSASSARTNLGLAIGTDVQAYNATLAAVAAGTYTGASTIATVGTITVGTWTGTAIAVANGGTGATSAGTARTNLGLAIGTDVQAYNATLAAVAAGTYTGSSTIVTLGTVTTGVWSGTAVAVAKGGTGATDAATARTNLGLAIGTDVQAYNATLATVAAGTYVGTSTIVTLGTVTTGTWNAGVVAGLYGGTGVANSGKTITLGGNLVTSGAFAVTFTLTNTTTVTLPTTGTLVNTAVTTLSSLVSIGTITTGVWNGTLIGAAYGGTGVANNAASTITISGNFGTTFTVTGTTAVTLPTTGTLVNTAVTTLSSLTSIGTLGALAVLSGTANSPQTTGHVASFTTSSTGMTTRTGTIAIESNSASAIDTGASVVFSGRYTNASTNSWSFGKIGAFKENSTNGDVASYLSISTTTSAGDLTERIKISSTGTVTILTGGIILTGNNPLRMAGVTAGTGTAAIVDGSGDLRTLTSSVLGKENIVPLTFDFDKFFSNSAKKYDYKDVAMDRESYGFIAEEMIENGFGELVTYNLDNEIVSFKYLEFTAYLFEALKDTRLKLQALEAQVNA